MDNTTQLIKSPKPKVTASPQNRPTRKDAMALELVLVTFGALNTLKAISEISGKPEVMSFADDLPKIKQRENRLEPCGHYREFLESLLSACGVVVSLQSLLKVCSNRIYLNDQREETKGFVWTWRATQRVIHLAIDALTGKPVNTDQK